MRGPFKIVMTILMAYILVPTVLKFLGRDEKWANAAKSFILKYFNLDFLNTKKDTTTTAPQTTA
jgi:hypothetical protein